MGQVEIQTLPSLPETSLIKGEGSSSVLLRNLSNPKNLISVSQTTKSYLKQL